jgi:D-glycero-alpha-D-manno-heptose-7-phosphate kinase
MGSSSSFTVGLLNALRAYRGQISSAECLAQEAIRIEQEVIQEAVGSQDQVWAAYGGTNLIRFHTDGTFDVAPVIMTTERRQELQSHMLLFFTRLSRNADTIAARKVENLQARHSQLSCIYKMAGHAVAILQSPSQPITEIGGMLHESWRLKRELADCVSTDAIDALYTAALDAGALGGKLLGAGGGGFMLIFAEPHTHGRIREALRGLIEVSFDIGSPGSRIVMYEPNGLGAKSHWA